MDRRYRVAQVIMFTGIIQLKKKKKRSVLVKKYRQQYCHMPLIEELRENYPDDFKNYLCMNNQLFNILLNKIRHKISKQDTVMRESINAEARLAATLRYLATGRSFEDLKFSTGISAPSLSKIIPKTCGAIYESLRLDYLKKIYYSRCGNPNRYSLEHCLAELEGGKYGFAFSSGHGAMTTICMMLSQGDHLLTDNEIYAGTACLFRKIISRMGIEITFTDFTNIKNIENSIKKNTKMVWVETPTNPTIKLLDIAAISKLVKSRGDILVCVDNTFLTSYFQKPLDLGADISMFSATKYINGHSDVVMGAAIVKDDKIAKILKSLQMYIGAVPSPMDCYLVTRSLTTLSLRMERHQQSSLIIAKWLLTQDHVLEVLHPGLPEHPQHELAKRQTSGHSGVFSFRHSGEFKESKTFLCALKLFALCISLGGTRSLVQLPSTMTHAVLSEKQRIDIGVTDSLIRLSIGLEDPEDLIKDLDQAFKGAFHK